ncbi:MAG: response regulator, partial [Thermodesulfobacteriota bacterium]
MSKATEPYVILTIDDEPLIRETFRFYLEDFGYRVLEAENGRVGLEVIEQHLPDLVLVDLRMPEVDGLDVLKVMKRTYPDIPVVVVSGTGFIGDAVEALRLGAWNYLLKPVEDLNMLIYAIEQSLDKARLIRENKEYRENLEEKVRLRTGELNRANDLLSQTRMQIVFRLGKTAEYRDKVTGRHVVRVSCYTRIIAQALGLDKDEADLVAMCSALHDVGKLGVPDYILNKPGRLDDEEWAIMKQHCRMGQEILSPLTIEDLAFMQKDNDECAELLSDSRLLKTARTIAYSHHERWDGKG